VNQTGRKKLIVFVAAAAALALSLGALLAS
jgi:hypothetical protein